jgi:hypothetical protein
LEGFQAARKRFAVKKSVKDWVNCKGDELIEAKEVKRSEARECHDCQKLGVRQDVYGWVLESLNLGFHNVIANRREDTERALLCLYARKHKNGKQVPHRRFAPVRNDSLLLG